MRSIKWHISGDGGTSSGASNMNSGFASALGFSVFLILFGLVLESLTSLLFPWALI
jgi:hypothetical protein